MKWAIDLSYYDAMLPDGSLKVMDWTRARDEAGLSLAIIKSSEALFADIAFQIQWQAAAGILPRAAYHFFRCNVDAIKQAQFCWSTLEKAGFGPGDYVILDFETMDGRLASQCLAGAGSWLYEMSKNGITPMIYTYPAFWRGVGGDLIKWAAKYPLALAQWPMDRWILNFTPTIFAGQKLADLKSKIETGALKPASLAPWTSPAIWQFTSRVDSRAVPGHPATKKVVDYNAIFMDLTPPVPPVPPTRCPTCGQTIQVVG